MKFNRNPDHYNPWKLYKSYILFKSVHILCKLNCFWRYVIKTLWFFLWIIWFLGYKELIVIGIFLFMCYANWFISPTHSPPVRIFLHICVYPLVYHLISYYILFDFVCYFLTIPFFWNFSSILLIILKAIYS